MFCIDASVIISGARGGEPYSNRSREFLNGVREEQQRVFLPEIAVPEVASGLMRGTKDAIFTKSFIESLRALPNFVFVAIDSRLADRAAHIAISTELRSADAIYVALAAEYNLTLVSLDRDQLKKGKHIVTTIEP